jgi:hypothetical protein
MANGRVQWRAFSLIVDEFLCPAVHPRKAPPLHSQKQFGRSRIPAATNVSIPAYFHPVDRCFLPAWGKHQHSSAICRVACETRQKPLGASSRRIWEKCTQNRLTLNRCENERWNRNVLSLCGDHVTSSPLRTAFHTPLSTVVNMDASCTSSHATEHSFRS